MVPSALTVQFSLALALQVQISAVAPFEVEAPLTLRHLPDSPPVNVVLVGVPVAPLSLRIVAEPAATGTVSVLPLTGTAVYVGAGNTPLELICLPPNVIPLVAESPEEELVDSTVLCAWL